MITKILEMIRENPSSSYQMINDEHLKQIVITSQTLAGSRVSKSTYQQVVFSDCVFYGVEFQGVVFDNCVFENCSFEFSHMRRCKFKNCSFENCTWKASSSIDTVYMNHVENAEPTFNYFELPIAC